MRATLSTIVLLLGTFNPDLLAQSQPSGWGPKAATKALDLAIVYAPERAKTVNTTSNYFWFQGAAADAAFTFYSGLGIAATLTGQTASNLRNKGSVSKISYLIGPRYTLDTSHAMGNEIGALGGSTLFGEALFGGIHGFNGAFPAALRTTPTANSLAYQFGGGCDLTLARGFALRIVEVDYFHSGLPNQGSGTQSDLRLGFGVSYHMSKRRIHFRTQ